MKLRRAAVVLSVPAAAAVAVAFAPAAVAQFPPFGGPGFGGEPPPMGVLQRTAEALPGCTLLAPFNVGETYLVDLDGRVVHQWKSEFPPGQAARLLPDGHLLRAARDPGESPMRGGGEGGRLEEFDWDGKLVWTYVLCDAQRRQHHSFDVMPNGHVLVIAWERKSTADAVEAGRDLEAAKEGLWPDVILEVKPTLPEGGEVVWEWHSFDHLIQDRDESLEGYGVVADHPELIDINVGRPAPSTPAEKITPEELERLKKLGYVGADAGGGDSTGEKGGSDQGPPPPGGGPRGFRGRGGFGGGADWNHINSVHYNAQLDQILLSSHNQSEIWVIDHGTTTEQAAGHSGGKRGHGGDLLYRWGNPANWHHGAEADRQLYGQHDARWIEPGLPGAGHVLVFNNNMRGMGFGFGPGGFGAPGRGGPGRAEGGGEDGQVPARAPSSEVFELELPLAADGSYTRAEGKAFGPAAPCWKYGGGEGEARFFSPVVSGAQRLANGDTLITSGTEGYCVEVTPKRTIAWEFRSPLGRQTGERPVVAKGDGKGDEKGDGKGEEAGGEKPPADGAGSGAPPRARGFAGPGGGGFRGPGGPGGFGGFGGPGGFMSGAVFRAVRIALDDPALKGRKLEPEAVRKKPL